MTYEAWSDAVIKYFEPKKPAEPDGAEDGAEEAIEEVVGKEIRVECREEKAPAAVSREADASRADMQETRGQQEEPQKGTALKTKERERALLERLLRVESEARKIREHTNEYKKISRETLINLQYVYNIEIPGSWKEQSEENATGVKLLFGGQVEEIVNKAKSQGEKQRAPLKRDEGISENWLVTEKIFQYLKGYQENGGEALDNVTLDWVIVHYLYVMDYKAYASWLHEFGSDEYLKLCQELGTPLSSEIKFLDELLQKTESNRKNAAEAVSSS